MFVGGRGMPVAGRVDSVAFLFSTLYLEGLETGKQPTLVSTRHIHSRVRCGTVAMVIVFAVIEACLTC